MSHPTDYKVQRRTEKQLAADAQELRRRLRVDDRLEFDPLLAIRWFQNNEIPGKGLLKVVPFDAAAGARLARVKFNPLKLMIQRPVWEAAIEEQDPNARFVLNHELGHIILHNNDAKAFSSSEAERLTSFDRECRAEWQADTFADHLSAPWKFIAAFECDVSKITGFCNVPLEVAMRQIASFRAAKKYSGDACPFCGGFSVFRKGWALECDNCGETLQCN